MRERFATIYTAALADILDGLGHRDQTLPPSIRPLAPGTKLAPASRPRRLLFDLNRVEVEDDLELGVHQRPASKAGFQVGLESLPLDAVSSAGSPSDSTE